MDSAKTFEEFKVILTNYEINTFSKYNVYQNPKGFLDEKRKYQVFEFILYCMKYKYARLILACYHVGYIILSLHF